MYLLKAFHRRNNYGVVFEDDGETKRYFYALERNPGNGEQRILDALHIYEMTDTMEKKSSSLLIIWSKDWLKCALVIDEHCHAIFDFEGHGGYNINEFPPPNEIWTKHGRKLDNELIQKFFLSKRKKKRQTISHLTFIFHSLK